MNRDNIRLTRKEWDELDKLYILINKLKSFKGNNYDLSVSRRWPDPAGRAEVESFRLPGSKEFRDSVVQTVITELEAKVLALLENSPSV